MIYAHLEFKVKHVMEEPLEGVTREMFDLNIEHYKNDFAAALKSDFLSSGREISDIEFSFVERF